MTPVVTVIIPCFNYGRFIAECVESLERQTLGGWRAIIVDDASTDGESPALCDAVRSDRVEVVHLPENRKTAAARNLAIEMAGTEALVSLDADDTLEPDYLASTVPLLLRDERCGIVYTDYRFFGDKSGVMYGRPFDPARLYVLQYIFAGSVFRKSAFDKTERYRQEAFGNEDWDVWLSIVEAGYHATYVRRPLYRQRKHAAQWSAQRLEALADEILRSRRLVRELHAEGLARTGQTRRFDFDTWVDDATWRIRAGDGARARESLLRALRARPWSLRPLALWWRSLPAARAHGKSRP
jgi:glycosyltransferase involved in cell wall biosynthesis